MVVRMSVHQLCALSQLTVNTARLVWGSLCYSVGAEMGGQGSAYSHHIIIIIQCYTPVV